MISNPNRIIHIDIAKGIGMALIVISHIWVSSSFAETQNFKIYDGIINSFYVPLFFILSGVFEKDTNDINKFYSRILHLINKQDYKQQNIVSIWFILALTYANTVSLHLDYRKIHITKLSAAIHICSNYTINYHVSFYTNSHQSKI